MTNTDDTTPRSTIQTARYHEVVAARLNAHMTLTVADLADEIAADEYGRPLSEVEPEVVCDIYLTLSETLLPSLARASLVAYDAESDLVSLPDLGSDSPADITERRVRWVDESDKQ